MSTLKKLRGGSDSELTRFKKLWLSEAFAESARDSLRALFVSDSTQAAIREHIKQAHGISLSYDGQLNAFRDWELEQRARDLEAERASEDERRLIAEHPDWTKDQVREEVLKRTYLLSLATGDFSEGRNAARQDLAERRFQFEKEQAAETRKSDQQRALEYCLEESKRWPDVQELFKSAFAALKSAKGK